MPDTTTISEAKAWCLEARACLGLSKSTKKDVKKRAGAVASELKKLQKALASKKKKAKSPIDQAQFDAYEAQFSDIGKALKKAAEGGGDSAEIERLSNLLDGLKLELAAHLAGKEKKKKAATDALSTRQDSNIEAAKALLVQVKANPEADSVAGDIAKLEAKLKEASDHSDAGEADKARAILTNFSKACAVVTAKADKIGVAQKAAYEKDLAETQTWIPYMKGHPANAQKVAKDLVKEANKKLASAKSAADSGAYSKAVALVSEAYYVFADADQKAVDYLKFQADLPDLKTRWVDYFNGQDATTKTTIKKELKTINDAYGKADAAGKAGKYAAGNKHLADLVAASDAANKQILAHAAYVKELADAKNYLAEAKKHPKAGESAIAKELADADKLIKKAESLAGKQKFSEAKSKCISAWLAANKAKKSSQKSFGDGVIAEADAVLKDIDKHAHKDILKGELTPIVARLEKAKKAAAKDDYYSLDSGRALSGELSLFADRAKKFLTAHDAFLKDHKARTETLAALEALDTEAVLTGDIGRIETKLKLAMEKAKGLDHDWANSLLAEVESDCAAAKTFLTSLKAGATAQEEAKGLIGKLAEDPDAAVKAVQALLDKCKSGTPPKAVTDRVGAVQALITKAGKAAKKDPTAAKKDLEKARKNCAELGLIAERHLRYLAKVKALETTIQELKDHGGHDDIAKRLLEIKKKMEAAEADAQEGKHLDAMNKLGEVIGICAAAKTKADLALKLKAEALDEAALSDLAMKPGGDALLDEVIASLGEKPPRKVVKAAMKARFGVELVLPGKEGAMDKGSKSLKKLYDLLLDAPEEYTKGNPKLQKIERYGDKTGSGSYKDSTGRIKLECGRTGDGREEELCATRHLPDVIDKCKPKGGNPPQFAFTAQHEIGHAVDAKIGFMDRKGKDGDKGKWESHGSDVSKVAKAGRTKTKYDEAAIKHYLEKKAWPSTDPVNPGPLSDEQWGQAKLAAQKWCDDIRNDLWWKGSLCKLVEVGGRVYQEAYDNDWVSYELSARTEGITGYQFRAPGEWFAELWAAYRSDKLKGGHPAMIWLKDIAPPKSGS